MTESENKMAEEIYCAELKMQSERLPGWEAFLDSDEKAVRYINDCNDRIEIHFRDSDFVLMSRMLNLWSKAWGRVNEVLAEKYLECNKNPELWELRYIKWMKITYIHFESKRGDFFLLPRRPRKRPRVASWYTVDEMLDMLHPAISAAIQLSDILPARPESIGRPDYGEKHLVVDYTGSETSVRYERARKRRG